MENPYDGITEKEKGEINRIGTSLNNVIRQGSITSGMQYQKDLLQRLIQNHTLKESIIVHRGVDSVEYELKLAKENGLSSGFLYHNAFVYTSLLEAYNRKIHLNIIIPAGTHYLYTGSFSNTCGIYPPLEGLENEDMVGELILDIGTVFKIDKIRRKSNILFYDVHVDNDAIKK